MDVDFYSLERSVQDRFADATRAIGLPTPILRQAPVDRRATYWLVGGAALLVSLVVVLVRGFGDLGSDVAIAPLSIAVVAGALVASATYCVLRALGIFEARSSMPFQPGLYLFPAGVIDARTAALRVLRVPEIQGTTLNGSTLRVEGPSGLSFSFDAGDAASAEQAKVALERSREQVEQATRADSRRELAMLDPLVDSGFASPFSPQHRISRAEPVWVKLSVVLALIAGAALGPLLWKARNVASEQRIYAAAVARNDIEGFRAYVQRGGGRTDIPEILLPRAELRVATAAGTVDSIEAFAAAHPGSRIQGEVDAALRAAVGAELDIAIQQGTVTALREFRERRKAYDFIRPAIEAAIVAHFRRLLGVVTPGKKPEVASFLERLLGYAKEHGPGVTIRFVRRSSDSMQAADTQVKLSAYFMGKQSIPSQYFTGDYAARREQAAGKKLADTLAAPFPADVLAPVLGETLVQNDPPAAPTEPTLFIDYVPELAGGYMSPKPRGVFVGAGLTFRMSFQIPGDNQPLELKSSLWRPPNPNILKAEGTTVADVYEKMAGDAFAKFMRDALALLGTS